MPADGTSAAKVRSGGFGTPPFYGQLSGKLHQLVYAYGHGGAARQAQQRFENILVRAGQRAPVNAALNYSFESKIKHTVATVRSQEN